ncbi:MAG TPA: carboxymuconolactone decarboxylase family protein [Kofleriaceae bacterium]|nr:carboxymuconolactone decarboxylase family protein [Kofleriaceae bacterium]
MKNPVFVLPEALDALRGLWTIIEKGGVPRKTHALVHLRASQINGCSVCLDLHARELEKLGETRERLFAVAGWRDAPWFTDAERAALALTESVTRLADRAEVPDDVYAEAARHYDEAALSSLILSISMINVWNRINVTTRQVPGQYA